MTEMYVMEPCCDEDLWPWAQFTVPPAAEILRTIIEDEGYRHVHIVDCPEGEIPQLLIEMGFRFDGLHDGEPAFTRYP